MNFAGGCYCDALRYESSSPPVECGYCHCRICQRTSAAPALAFASFPVDDFHYTKGQPSIYQSSKHGSREYCSTCGTQIAFRSINEAETVDVNVGSLDDPSTVTPQHHIWCQSQIKWFEVKDDLPRYQQDKPDNHDD